MAPNKSLCIKLNNGIEMPTIGMGTFDATDLANMTKSAIDIGYRCFDTAYIYQNEKEIGEGIAAKISDGTVKREDIFYITKLWSTKHRPKSVLPCLKQSLADAKLDYVDLYLIQLPIACKKIIGNKFEIFSIKEEEPSVTIEDTWRAVEECVKLGLAKSIGLSNFNSQQIERILKICTIKPVVAGFEVNPYMNNKKLISFCKERNIQVLGYSSFYAPGRRGCDNELGLNLFEEPILKEMACKYHKTVAQIIIRYVMQLGTVPFPKPDTLSQLEENYNVFDFELNDDDFAKVESLNRNLRCTQLRRMEHFREYPFHIEF